MKAIGLISEIRGGGAPARLLTHWMHFTDNWKFCTKMRYFCAPLAYFTLGVYAASMSQYLQCLPFYHSTIILDPPVATDATQR